MRAYKSDAHIMHEYLNQLAGYVLQYFGSSNIMLHRWQHKVTWYTCGTVSIECEGTASVFSCKQKLQVCHVNHKQNAIVQMACMMQFSTCLIWAHSATDQ